MTDRTKTLSLCIAVITVLGLVIGVLYYVSYKFAEAFTPVTDPSRYASILNENRDSFAKDPLDADVLTFFPKAIPQGASNVQFCSSNVPGDSEFELRCVLPPDDINALVARVAPIALVTVSGNEGMPSVIDPSKPNQELYSPYFNTGDVPGKSYLSFAFTIYVVGIGHGKTRIQNEGHWDYEYGIAVDREHKDVIFWMNGTARP